MLGYVLEHFLYFSHMQSKILSSTYGQPIGRCEFTHQSTHCHYGINFNTLNINIIEIMA
jgi:hypothetical protein